MQRALSDYPDPLTVEEAADYLQINRALGYEVARKYRTTDGAAVRFLLDPHARDRAADHQLLDLLGAFEDVVDLI